MSQKFIKLTNCGSLLSLFSYGAMLCILHACNNEINRSFSISNTLVGVLFMMIYVWYIPSALITGAIADRRGKLQMILLGICLIIAGPALFLMTKNYWLALIAVSLMGLGAGAVDTNAIGIIGDINQGGDRSRMISFTQTVFGIGALLGPFLTGIFIKYFHTFRPVFLFVITVAFAGAVIVLKSMGMKEEKPLCADGTKTPWGEIFRDRYIYLILAAIICYCGSEFSFSGWVAVYFEKILKTSPFAAAQSVSLFWLGITLGSFIFAELMKKVSRIFILKIACVGIVIGFLVFSIPNIWTALFGTFAVGFCLGPVFPLIVAFGSAKYSKNSGAVNSVILTAANIAGIVFSPLVGRLADRFSIMTALWVVFVLTVCNMIIFSSKKFRDDSEN